jgi:hypothetical protein
MDAQLDSLPPVPESLSPLNTATISLPSGSSSSPPRQEEDRALLANEVVEALAIAVLDAQEQEHQQEEEEHHQQHPSPLETTSRALSPIETRLERGDQHSAGEEAETPTQVFQTPISPSHTGVVGYQSPVEEEEEAAELPLLEALGETTAPLASSAAVNGEEDKFTPKVEEEPTTEDKFQPQVEEQMEERFAPAVERELAVPGFAVTKPTMETGGNEVVLSEEEVEEIQRSPGEFYSEGQPLGADPLSPSQSEPPAPCSSSAPSLPSTLHLSPTGSKESPPSTPRPSHFPTLGLAPPSRLLTASA